MVGRNSSNGGIIMEIITRQEAKEQGLSRYFTGKPCKRGHVCERFIKSTHCIECGNVRSKKYVQENPERRKDSWQKYDSKPCSKLAKKQARLSRITADPDYYKKTRKRYREKLVADIERLDELKKRAREYSRRPEVRERANLLEKYKRNHDPKYRDSKNIKTQLRRRRIRQATPPWLDTKSLIIFYKNAMQLKKDSGIEYAVDHYYPLQGESVCGLNVPWNLQVITHLENSAKHNRMPEEFYGPERKMKGVI